MEGHVADELVADCLRDLKSKQTDVKFLGSYPAAGPLGESARRDAGRRLAGGRRVAGLVARPDRLSSGPRPIC